MAESVYVINDIIGASAVSWEDAADQAISAAAKVLDDVRIAEVVKKDITLANGKVTSYRVMLNVSLRYQPWWNRGGVILE